MDAGFNVIDTSNMLGTDLTKQDIAYYDNHIYFACYESGHITQYQSNYFNSKEKHSNLIYVYDVITSTRSHPRTYLVHSW